MSNANKRVKSGGRELPNMNGSLTLEKPLSFCPIDATTVKVTFPEKFATRFKFLWDLVLLKVSFVLSGDPRQFTWDESGIFEVSSPPEQLQRVGSFQTRFHICHLLRTKCTHNSFLLIVYEETKEICLNVSFWLSCQLITCGNVF